MLLQPANICCFFKISPARPSSSFPHKISFSGPLSDFFCIWTIKGKENGTFYFLTPPAHMGCDRRRKILFSIFLRLSPEFFGNRAKQCLTNVYHTCSSLHPHTIFSPECTVPWEKFAELMHIVFISLFLCLCQGPLPNWQHAPKHNITGPKSPPSDG